MTPQAISDKLKAKFGDAILEVKIEGVVQPFVKISPQRIGDVAQFLRDDPDLQFDYLMCLSGVDTGREYWVVYSLHSLTHFHKASVKIVLPRENAECDTVCDIWAMTNFFEREAYDLIGIIFTGHPDMRRILLDEDWIGHPLRKDYKHPDFYRGMKVPY